MWFKASIICAVFVGTVMSRMLIVHQNETEQCEKRENPYFISHKTDCSKFYACVKGKLFVLPCPVGYRFDSVSGHCSNNKSAVVWQMAKCNHDKIGQLNKTTISQTTQTLTTHLLPATTTTSPKVLELQSHESNCGWYYIVRPSGDRVLNSCPMPLLFDEYLLECKPYKQVKCKKRFEPKDACDYRIRSGAHAYPCNYLPSCRNKTDGFYPDRLRDCRVYFRCFEERSSESWSCSQKQPPFGERFSIEHQKCMPANDVDCQESPIPFF